VELAANMDELVAGFDVGSFGAAPTKFDAEDLFPLTRHHVQSLPFETVRERVLDLGVPEGEAEAFWAVAKGNITVLADLEEWWTLFRDGAEPVIDPADRDFVAQALGMLPPQPWTQATWGDWTAAVKEATGRKGKDLFRPLRRALTGRDAGPEMADVMPLLRRVPSV
jgi:glutamyl-tRNA synthetase